MIAHAAELYCRILETRKSLERTRNRASQIRRVYNAVIARFVLRAKELGIPCVVVSSSPKRYLAEGLARAGILECFKALVTTDTVGSSKQEPAIYQAAVDELGCAPDRVWAFDDAPYAIAAMHAFGLKTACVGNRSSQFADLNPQSFEELLAD